jgi:hypothetical protein
MKDEMKKVTSFNNSNISDNDNDNDSMNKCESLFRGEERNI